ncbi:hypothetical protein QWY28_21650 [Nocardioides sp. SOB77]|uniref:SRPBCC family protein n=1 Tax=Nocardioides oceani TaxID=3058369 RepID=A0ABT8FLM9_9ACTN|nr:hypothetical protein [Nocardioides oceani]MDN4175582.1 hypothetical protein [Nocardioides oceani]
MRLPLPGRPRRDTPDLGVRRGERLLAWSDTSLGPVGGTREALYLPDRRVPWEEVQAAHWDRDSTALVVREVGTWGEPQPVHRLSVAEPGRLLELVRERVSASVVLTRHVPVVGGRGLRVVARRAAAGDRALTWAYELDEGLDPDDPGVREAAERGLAAARAEVEPG